MDLRDLRFVCELARMRHFTMASENLGISQPVLSKALSELERDLGTKLFSRTSRRVRLTPAGEAFIAGAARILSDVSDLSALVAQYSGTLRGRVTVGTIRSVSEYRLPAIIAAFRRRHPGVEVFLRETVTAELLDGLRNGFLDLAIVHADAVSHAPDLGIEPIGVDDMSIVLAPTHRFASRPRLRLEDLRDEPFIAYPSGSGVRSMLVRAATAAGFSPRIVCETTNSTTMRALINEGVGIALAPRLHFESPGPSVTTVRLAPRLVWQYVLATRCGASHNPAADAFLAATRADFGTSVVTKLEE